MKYDKLKICIAGLGIVGQRRLQIIKSLKFYEVVAICDTKFKKEYFSKNDNVYYYKSYLSLFKHKFDAIFVCMPNDIAPKVVKYSLNKNKHVFCEKPPGRNLSDIKSILRVKNKYKNLSLVYGFNHRFHRSIIDAKKIIESKKLGKIISIKCLYGKSKLITFNQTDWRTKREIAGGGILLDQGIHIIDLLRYFAGEFKTEKSYVLNNFWKHDVEDNVYAFLKNKEGVIAFVHSSATQWMHKFEIDINLTKGSLILSGILSSSKSYGDEKLKVIKSNKNSRKLFKETEYKYHEDPSWENEIISFYKIINKKQRLNNGSPVDALNSMKLVFDIYYADKKWRKKFSIKKN